MESLSQACPHDVGGHGACEAVESEVRGAHPLARPEFALVATVLFLNALQAHLLVLRLRHLAPVRPRLRVVPLSQSNVMACFKTQSFTLATSLE